MGRSYIKNIVEKFRSFGKSIAAMVNAKEGTFNGERFGTRSV